MVFIIQIFGYSLFIKKEEKKKASVNKQIWFLSITFFLPFFSLFFTLFCTITTICLGKNCTGS